MKPFILILAVFLLGGMTASVETPSARHFSQVSSGHACGTLLAEEGDFRSGRIDPCTLYGAVFVEEVESFADYKIFREEDEGFSDLIVFKEQARSFADRNGLWYFTDVRGFADFTIAFTEVQGFADLNVHFTEFKSLAGCRE